MLNTTRTNDPLHISGTLELATERLSLVFTPDADEETVALFYSIFSPTAWSALKESEQLALLADVVARAERAESASALNLVASAAQPKE